MATADRSLPRFRYRCPDCKEKHEGLPAVGYGRPDDIFALSAAERDARAWISPSLCILDDTRYFLRCRLGVPISDTGEVLEFGPWLEVTGPDYAVYATTIITNTIGRPRPIEGGLATNCVGMGNTIGVHCRIEAEALMRNERPLLQVLDRDSRIGRAQANGISVAEAIEIGGSMKGFVVLVE